MRNMAPIICAPISKATSYLLNKLKDEGLVERPIYGEWKLSNTPTKSTNWMDNDGNDEPDFVDFADIVGGKKMTDPETLHTLARRVRYLHPSRHDPERFHIEKDEIERMLRRLARRMEKEGYGKYEPSTPHRNCGNRRNWQDDDAGDDESFDTFDTFDGGAE